VHDQERARCVETLFLRMTVWSAVASFISHRFRIATCDPHDPTQRLLRRHRQRPWLSKSGG
jgi:hypothetical protein